MRKSYLSESELEVLIEKVEENELISAPSSLMEKVLEEIEETNEEKPNTPEYMERKEHASRSEPQSPMPKQEKQYRKKKMEFYWYCTQVAAMVCMVVGMSMGGIKPISQAVECISSYGSVFEQEKFQVRQKESWEQEDVFSKLEKSKTVGKIRKKINQK